MQVTALSEPSFTCKPNYPHSVFKDPKGPLGMELYWNNSDLVIKPSSLCKFHLLNLDHFSFAWFIYFSLSISRPLMEVVCTSPTLKWNPFYVDPMDGLISTKVSYTYGGYVGVRRPTSHIQWGLPACSLLPRLIIGPSLAQNRMSWVCAAIHENFSSWMSCPFRVHPTCSQSRPCYLQPYTISLNQVWCFSMWYIDDHL